MTDWLAQEIGNAAAEAARQIAECRTMLRGLVWEEYHLMLLREERAYDRRSGWQEATGFPVTDLGGESG